MTAVTAQRTAVSRNKSPRRVWAELQVAARHVVLMVDDPNPELIARRTIDAHAHLPGARDYYARLVDDVSEFVRSIACG